jgi:TPR repeat protein
MIRDGEKMSRDLGQAAQWFRTAANKGHAKAAKSEAREIFLSTF